jgi:cytochrome d ubiquinol oxidase subunit II
MMVGAAVGLYPRLLPSSLDPAHDLTIQKALSGPYALRVGLAWWVLGMLLASTYFFVIYRMFRGKVSLEGGGYDH